MILFFFQDPLADPLQLMEKHSHPYIIAISSQITGQMKYYIDIEKRLLSVSINLNCWNEKWKFNASNWLFCFLFSFVFFFLFFYSFQWNFYLLMFWISFSKPIKCSIWSTIPNWNQLCISLNIMCTSKAVPADLYRKSTYSLAEKWLIWLANQMMMHENVRNSHWSEVKW